MVEEVALVALKTLLLGSVVLAVCIIGCVDQTTAIDDHVA
jgi:hypothetical protein